jgi:hypothetical protein
MGKGGQSWKLTTYIQVHNHWVNRLITCGKIGPEHEAELLLTFKLIHIRCGCSSFEVKKP